MRKFLVILLVCSIATSAFAVEGSEVMYVGGTVLTLTPGNIGTLDTTQNQNLVFTSGGKKLSVDYDKITKVEYRAEVAHHLGIAPTIAVALIKRRERKHFITLTFGDELGKGHAAVFEVPKGMPRTLLAALTARAPRACVLSHQYETQCLVTPTPKTMAAATKP